MSKPVQVEVVLSHSEHLPAVDVWLVVDILRATTVMVRWFEVGGSELYPADSVENASRLAERLRREGSTPLLMGEQNAIAPQGFDLGNSPLDIKEDLTQKYTCAVMATTNGTKAILKAASTGTPVLVASARNASAVLDLALSKGRRIGIFCSGRKGRPAWDDTLCAGLLTSCLADVFPDIHLADSARLACLTWRSSGDFRSSLRSADHAVFLDRIGFGNDISAAAEIDVARVVPELHEIPDGGGMLPCLRQGLKSPDAFASEFGAHLQAALARPRDPLPLPAAGTEGIWREIVHSGSDDDPVHVFFGGKDFRKQYANKSKKS